MSGWVRQLTAGGRMLWAPPSQGTWDQDSCLLFYSPLRSPSLPITAPKRLKSLRSVQIVTSRQKPPVCVFLWCVEVLSPMSAIRPPCLSVCLLVHIFALPHTPPYDYRLPTEVLCFDKEGEGEGGRDFFLAVENGGEFYDPCSLSSCKNHTSRFPALQHHRLRSQWKQWSVWRRNKANKEGKKSFLEGNTCRSTLYIYIILSLPIRLRGRPPYLLTHM